MCSSSNCNTLCFNKKRPYLNMFMKALSNVKDIYMEYETYQVIGDELQIITKRAEKVFAYELYHQFRKLMPEDCGYYINGEIWKDKKIIDKENVSSCYPDLVLHGSLGCVDVDTQYFLCEIKMSTNQNLLDDLDKLTKLSESGLHFKSYIFLCVGKSKQELSDEIMKKNPTELYNGEIVCICKTKECTDIFELNEILNKQKQVI